MIIDQALILASSESNLGVGLAGIVVFGVGAQLLASRIQIPAILLLLLGGVLVGPVLEIVQPDELLGDLLFPAVSLAVGILLFEGGLGLRWAELQHHGRGPIIRLITVGVLVTWAIGGVAAYFLVDVDRNAAILLGAILVVSGPTVVLPLIRFARVREPVNGILKWEGIFIDPVGATLAIVVLDAVIENEGTGAGASIERILTTAAAGTVGGLIGAGVLTLLFNRHWVPDNLHNPFTLAMVVAAFAGADLIQPEAGLFATTVMGVALANQRWAPIAHIREFEENLGSLILAGLFIVLGARVDLDLLVEYLPESIVLSLILIVVARPIAVYLSTVGSGLSFVERAYLACMSPRGIVAASVSALFALELEEAGQPVEALAPVTFIVIVTTVLFSAVASRVGARRFRVARPAPRGVAFIGGPDWALDLAAWLSDHEIPALVITTDPFEVDAATRRGVLSYQGNLDSEDLLMAMDSVGIRVVVGVSRFQEVNTLVIDRAAEAIGRANVFFLPRSDEGDDSAESSHAAVMARRPFGKDATQVKVEQMAAFDWKVRAVTAETFDRKTLEGAIPLLSIDDDGPTVLISSPEKAPAEGVVRVYLAGPHEENAGTDVQERDTQGSGGSAEP